MRTSPQRFIKIVFVISTLFFLLVIISYLDRNDSDDLEDGSDESFDSDNDVERNVRYYGDHEGDDDSNGFNHEAILERLRHLSFSNASENYSRYDLIHSPLPRYVNLSETRHIIWDINQ